MALAPEAAVETQVPGHWGTQIVCCPKPEIFFPNEWVTCRSLLLRERQHTRWVWLTLMQSSGGLNSSAIKLQPVPRKKPRSEANPAVMRRSCARDCHCLGALCVNKGKPSNKWLHGYPSLRIFIVNTRDFPVAWFLPWRWHFLQNSLDSRVYSHHEKLPFPPKQLATPLHKLLWTWVQSATSASSVQKPAKWFTFPSNSVKLSAHWKFSRVLCFGCKWAVSIKLNVESTCSITPCQAAASHEFPLLAPTYPDSQIQLVQMRSSHLIDMLVGNSIHQQIYFYGNPFARADVISLPLIFSANNAVHLCWVQKFCAPADTRKRSCFVSIFFCTGSSKKKTFQHCPLQVRKPGESCSSGLLPSELQVSFVSFCRKIVFELDVALFHVIFKVKAANTNEPRELRVVH